MEPRGVVAVPEAFGGHLTLYSATQIPHILKVMLAVTTGIPEQKIRVVAPSVGGGFGSKLNVYAEEVLCAALAVKLGRPVRWTEDRVEGGLSTIQGRGQVQDIELAADDDGRITAVRVRAAGRHGCVPAARHAGHPAARRVPLPRRLRHPGLLVSLHRRVHEPHADRRVSRRRATRGPLRDRARRSTRWRATSGSRPTRSGAATTSRPTSSRTRARRAGVRQRRLRARRCGAALELVRYDERRAEQRGGARKGRRRISASG